MTHLGAGTASSARRVFAFAGALAVAAPFASGHAEASQAGAGTASLRLAIRVPRIARLTLLDHPAVLRIAPEDLARGYVLVRGTALRLVHNDRRGVIVRAALAPNAVGPVEILGLGEPVAVGAGGTAIAFGPSRAGSDPGRVPIEYRVHFGPTLAPGSYRWPVILSLEDP